MLTTHIVTLVKRIFIRRDPRMFDDVRARWLLIGAAFSHVLVWAFALWQVHPQEEQLYLHYNIYFGVDLIGPWYRFYLLPVIGLVILFVNIALARILFRKEKMMPYIILGITMVYQLLLLLASYLIIQQNGKAL